MLPRGLILGQRIAMLMRQCVGVGVDVGVGAVFVGVRVDQVHFQQQVEIAQRLAHRGVAKPMSCAC